MSNELAPGLSYSHPNLNGPSSHDERIIEEALEGFTFDDEEDHFTSCKPLALTQYNQDPCTCYEGKRDQLIRDAFENDNGGEGDD